MQIQQLYTTNNQRKTQKLLTFDLSILYKLRADHMTLDLSILYKLSADHIKIFYNDKNVKLE